MIRMNEILYSVCIQLEAAQRAEHSKKKKVHYCMKSTLAETGESLTTLEKRSEYSADESGSPNCSRVPKTQLM